MWRFLRAIVLLCACGCQAVMVNNPRHPGRYAPVDAAQTGVIRYRSGGLLGDARRENAYKQMFEACRGHYKILDESSDLQGAVAAPLAGGVVVRTLDDRYIRFVCTDPRAPADGRAGSP